MKRTKQRLQHQERGLPGASGALDAQDEAEATEKAVDNLHSCGVVET